MAIDTITRSLAPGTSPGPVPTTTRGASTRFVAPMLALAVFTAFGPAARAGVVSSITTAGNSTAIAAGSTIWFNSVLKLVGTAPTTPFTIFLTNSTITVNSQTLNVPNAAITFDTTATQSTTTFNTGTNTWVTTLPSTSLSGNQFLNGFGYVVPAALASGMGSATWTAEFSATAPVKLNWAFAGAVYTTFSTDNNALGVKPVDDNSSSIYLNSDKAGTPENFKAFITGGGTGGGGSNFTGSLSGTNSVDITTAVPEPSSLVLAAMSGALILGTFGRGLFRRSRAA
jgi:hypothetical protein